MGLDMWIFKKSKNFKIKMLEKLNGEYEHKEVAYWRKDYFIQNWFAEWFGEMENTKDYIINKKCLKELIKYLEGASATKLDAFISGRDRTSREKDIKLIKKILDETDFKNEELIYHAWW